MADDLGLDLPKSAITDAALINWLCGFCLVPSNCFKNRLGTEHPERPHPKLPPDHGSEVLKLG